MTTSGILTLIVAVVFLEMAIRCAYLSKWASMFFWIDLGAVAAAAAVWLHATTTDLVVAGIVTIVLPYMLLGAYGEWYNRTHPHPHHGKGALS